MTSRLSGPEHMAELLTFATSESTVSTRAAASPSAALRAPVRALSACR